MSVLGSMFTGVSGINAQSQKLSTISENIANANTIGYKRIETKFATFVTESTPVRHSPGGVSSSIHHETDMQGLLQATLSETDVAISGNGYMIVNESAEPTVGDEYLYTRAGAFEPDSEGNLVNTAGYFLQGWPLDLDGNLPTDNSSLISLETVNIGQITGSPRATSTVELGFNLPANSEIDANGDGAEPDARRTADVVVFDSLGIAQTIRMGMTHVDTNTWHLTVNPGANGVVNDIFDSNGNRVNVTNGATAGANQLDNAEPSAIGGNYGYLIVEFNSDGTLREIRDPSLVDAGAAQTTVYNNDNQTLDIEFDFSATGANDDQVISFNLGRFNNNPANPNVAEGVTQYDADFFTSFINQNGVRFGSFSGVDISEQGVVTAIYDNGQKQPLYQIPLASFANPTGLDPRTGNAYAQTDAAGEFIMRQAGQAGAGDIVSSSVEMSTVDIAEEFSDMIVTQRSYSANTRIISTADEMIAELIQVTG